MAEGKKSFVLYVDSKETWEELTDEQAGKLIKHIYKYVNDENPIMDDQLLNIAFLPIKHQLKRDLKRWESKQKQRSEAGKRSAEIRASKQNEKQRKATTVKSRSTKSTVSVNVNDSVSVSVSDSVIKKEPSCPRNYSDDDYIMSEFIFDRVKAIYPNAKQPNLDKWANTIRLIREYDKLSHKQIQTVFIWANNNSFWQANIRSPEKLREKYEELDIKMQSENSNGTYQQALTPQQQLDSSISETQKYIDSLQ